MRNYISYMERGAQQGMLKRAMDAAWIASTCIGMVYGPLSIALETGGADKSVVDEMVRQWLRHWQDIRNMSDRNLHRNRDYYQVRPNEILSPILARFESRLESILSLESSTEMLVAVKDAYMATLHELIEFNQWANSIGSSIDFDAAKYDEQAVRRAHRYWSPTVRQLQKMMG